MNLNHNNYADCLLCLKSITKLKFVLIMTGQQAARLTGSKADRQQSSHTADPKVEIIFGPADIWILSVSGLPDKLEYFQNQKKLRIQLLLQLAIWIHYSCCAFFCNILTFRFFFVTQYSWQPLVLRTRERHSYWVKKKNLKVKILQKNAPHDWIHIANCSKSCINS